MQIKTLRKHALLGLAALALGLGWWTLAAATPAAGPEAAPNLALSNVSQGSVQVRWDPIADASRYELSYGTDSEATNRSRVFVSNTSQILTSLMPNTLYRVKVRAVISGRAGAWSAIKEFSTQIPVIGGLAADDVRDTSAHLIWSGMFSDLPDTSYEISYGSDQDASSEGIISTTKNFLTLHNLSPETTYYLKLRGRNAKIVGPWSTPQSITTLSHSTVTAPTELTVQSSEHGAVVIGWRTISDASNYDLAYGTDPVAEGMGIVPAYENRFTLQLPPNTIYYLKVRAVIKGNSGPWSGIQKYLTLPAAPRGLMVAAQSSTSAVINWRSLTGGNFARYYHLSWGTDPQAANLGVTLTANAEYELAGLRPNRGYFVRVRTVNATGTSPWSDPISFTTLPEGLTQVRVLEVHHTAAKLDWPSVPAAVAYEIALGTREDGSDALSSESAQPPAEVKDLRPDQTYYFRIRPLFASLRPGPWSNLVNFTTFPIPPVPQGLTVAAIGGTYVRLTWTAAADVSTYEVLLATDEIADKGRSVLLNRTEIQLSPLEENTNYFIRVRAVNLGGPGSWSEPAAAITLPDLPPRNLTVSNVLPTEALLRWENIPGSAPALYEIRYAPEKYTWRVLPNYPGQTLGLDKLEDNSLYRAQVRAKNQAGYGPWSAEINFRTPPLPPQTAPEGLRAEGVTDIFARVVWKRLPEIDGYLFSQGTDTDASDRGVEKLGQTEYSLKGLMPETNYFVKVKAFNQTGEGPWSEVLMISTRPAPPVSAPAGVTVEDVTALSFRLTWQAAEDALSYEVSLGTEPRGGKAALIPELSTAHLFTDLRPETVYYARVRKVNRGSNGPWSRMQTVTTRKR